MSDLVLILSPTSGRNIMETQIINGRKIRNEILEDVKKGVFELSFQPVFCDILVGDDPVSAQYVAMKARTAESVGIAFHNANFKNDIKKEELIIEINKIENIENMSGIITQLPLPDKSIQSEILNSIDIRFDVDCLNEFIISFLNWKITQSVEMKSARMAL